MKKLFCLFAVLGLLVACQGKENPSGGDDNSGGNKEVVATAIKLNKHELTLEKGANETLSVTFTPSNVTNKAVTWVSSDKSIADVTDGNVVAVNAGSTEIVVKQGNLTDKCTVAVVISAKSITLNKESVELTVGGSETLTATVEPAGTTDKIEWSSSAEGIATVNGGVVTAQAIGTATITAKAGSQTATCEVVVKEPIVLEAVDLGLSVKWANANLGAYSEEAFGDYFAWGETEPYYSSFDPTTLKRAWKEGKADGYDFTSYKWCNGVYDKLIKYCPDNKKDYWDGAGSPDNKMTLEPEDDAAHVKLGGEWRIPTDAEWTELRDNCTWTGVTNYNGSGINGCLVIATNGNSIFLPSAGMLRAKKTEAVGYTAHYWSSSLSMDRPFYAWLVSFSHDTDGFSKDDIFRCYGLSIRPVTE